MWLDATILDNESPENYLCLILCKMELNFVTHRLASRKVWMLK